MDIGDPDPEKVPVPFHKNFPPKSVVRPMKPSGYPMKDNIKMGDEGTKFYLRMSKVDTNESLNKCSYGHINKIN